MLHLEVYSRDLQVHQEAYYTGQNSPPTGFFRQSNGDSAHRRYSLTTFDPDKSQVVCER